MQHLQRNHIMILCMDHCRHTQLPCCYHYIQYCTIAELHWIISHVEFDAGDALFSGENRKLLFYDLLGGIGEDKMERVVAESAPFCESAVVFDEGQDSVVFAVLRGKSYDRRRSSADGTTSASFPGISGWSIPLLEMYVCIDAAWRDESTFAVQNFRLSRIRTLKVFSNAKDHSIFNAYVLSDDAIC